MNIRTVLSALLLFFFAASPVMAAPADSKKNTPSSSAISAGATKPAPGPVSTNIKAERVDYDADRQTVVFFGNVYVKRPDFELWADKMTVYLKKKNKTEEGGAPAGMEAGDIDRIVCEKNVRMKREDKEGTSQKATYYADSDKIVLEGSPVLRDKSGKLEAAVITHYLKENKSEATRNVEIEFRTDGDGKGKMGFKSGLKSPGSSKKEQ